MIQLNDEKFLNCLYHNTKSATQLINNLIPKVLDNQMKKELKEMLSAHSRLCLVCEDLSRVYDIDIADNNIFAKMKLWWEVNMNTFFSKENKKIANLVIMANTVGVVDLIEKMSIYSFARKQFKEIAKELLSLERANIKKMEHYLLVEQNITNKQCGINPEKEVETIDLPSPSEVKDDSKQQQENIIKAHESKENIKPLTEADKDKAKQIANRSMKNDL